MSGNRHYLFFLPLLLCAFSASAQNPSNSGRLFSPSAAQKFYETARELANLQSGKTPITGPEAEQALVLLTASAELDNRADYIIPDMIKLASRSSSPLTLGIAYIYERKDVNDPNAKMQIERNNSELVYNLLIKYVNKSVDLEVAREAVQYLLDNLDTREQREELLKKLLYAIQEKNSVFESELFTMLGMLMSERADFETAKMQFIHAFDKNKYNRIAFAKFSELEPNQINPVIYLEHLRFQLGENPLDIEAALAFANYAQQLELFQLAADASGYSADLFEYLYPSEPLPAYIYLTGALNNYNTKRNPFKVLQIAEKVRESGIFDLKLEAVAAKAAQKTGAPEKAERILQAAEEKINNQSSTTNNQSSIINNQSIAWFYCFGLADPDKAIDWANKAYSAEPNSQTAAALLAYSFVMNDQFDWARPITESYNESLILNLTKAQIQLADGQKDTAIETLKSVIAFAPQSLEAERARDILAQNNAEYLPPLDTEVVLSVLRNTFGETIVPKFARPDEIISVQLSIRGNKFAYGSNFGASLVITNNSSEPLIVSDYGLFTGRVRIDAVVSGDINRKISELVSVRVQPSLPVGPGACLIVPLQLVSGELKKLLMRHPQASLEIEFTVYLDPVIIEGGRIVNRLEDIKPVTTIIERPGIEITAQYLRNRMNSLTRKHQSQKTAELFVGLLTEQDAMANQEPLYKFTYADWMPEMLKSALAYCLSGDDWTVKVNTTAAMYPLPLDYELIEAVSQNLNDTYWPSRLMALYLLAKNQDSSFKKVLDWTAEYDQNKLVRDMAIALGAANPEGS